MARRAAGRRGDAPVAQDARRRLEALRLDALELRISADLAAGRHAELVPEVQRLVAEEPFREGLRASLVVALYRCGRQADALRAYEEGRLLLAEELGADPAPGAAAAVPAGAASRSGAAGARHRFGT
jgi:DNA-binding SARP family transcriptional activator